MDEDHLWVGGGQYVPVSWVDRVLLSGTMGRRATVVLKSGEHLLASRSFRALAQDLKRLRERRRLEKHGRDAVRDPNVSDTLSSWEAAEIAGCSLEKMQRLSREAKIQASKVDGRWVIDRWSLYLWLADRE